jgi:hypothetical protein
MPGDTRRSQRLNFTIKYSNELSEEIPPSPLGAGPVVGPQEFVKVRSRDVNRVFYFLTCTSLICLSAVVLYPRPIVQATALTIWAGSVGLARFLLVGAYRNTRINKAHGK